MPRLRYSLVDVFTNRPFGGNPLAVIHDARGLSAETMQSVAKEFNLSETTFILPADDPKHTYRVRIFTPGQELPMAGHPTVGTAFIMAREHFIELTAPETQVIFEEGVGPIPVTLTVQDDHVQSIRMRQPLPTFGARFTDRETIARMLSLDVMALDPDLPIQVVSCGVPFLYVPVRNLQAMHAICLRRDIWEETLQNFEAQDIFMFTRETELPGSTVHSRMFAPTMGIAEDPATGAASGPLGSYLVRYGLVESSGIAHIVSEQGVEMGRPSILNITIEHSGKEITAVYVGGQCQYMGEGVIELPD